MDRKTISESGDGRGRYYVHALGSAQGALVVSRRGGADQVMVSLAPRLGGRFRDERTGHPGTAAVAAVTHETVRVPPMPDHGRGQDGATNDFLRLARKLATCTHRVRGRKQWRR